MPMQTVPAVRPPTPPRPAAEYYPPSDNTPTVAAAAAPRLAHDTHTAISLDISYIVSQRSEKV